MIPFFPGAVLVKAFNVRESRGHWWTDIVVSCSLGVWGGGVRGHSLVPRLSHAMLWSVGNVVGVHLKKKSETKMTASVKKQDPNT